MSAAIHAKSGGTMPALLTGLKVVELASDRAAYAGKLMGDLGADVIVVEAPGGHASRLYGPFVADQPDPDRCLWWWNYNTSKRSVVLDLASEQGRADFRRLAESADIVRSTRSASTTRRSARRRRRSSGCPSPRTAGAAPN
jgi:crotonobetainyl-CoA:carnitine CoA-transferase CaiB-like acyl-CoA transferase